MTLSRLIKELQKLEAEHGRCKVCVDKNTLYDGNETFSVCRIKSVQSQWVYNASDDGGVKYNKDGTESGSTTIVLCGESQ